MRRVLKQERSKLRSEPEKGADPLPAGFGTEALVVEVDGLLDRIDELID